MAYKRPAKQTNDRSLEEMIGYVVFEDSFQRQWLVSVLTLRETPVFWQRYADFAANADSADVQARFIGTFLKANRPSWVVRFRRLLGLPDFSLRFIGANFYGRDFEGMLDAIFNANWGKSFKEFIEECKKKAGEVTAE